MLYVITLYAVPPDSASSFVDSVRREWPTFARTFAPALIGTDLLEHRASAAPPFLLNSSVLFVCLDLWMSQDGYRGACENTAFRALLFSRRKLASSAFELGAFAFPASPDTEMLPMQAAMES